MPHQQSDESQIPQQVRSRGTWYLVVQACLLLLVVFGPRSFPGIPEWNASYLRIASLAGAVLMVSGVLLSATGVVTLGRNLTPLPIPKQNAVLVVTGAYRIVRHPIYSGIICIAFGWGVWLGSWLTIGYALLILAFFDSKSRFEERLLDEKFPDYDAYRKRVRKLLPFIY